jgi:hypothetical protein
MRPVSVGGSAENCGLGKEKPGAGCPGFASRLGIGKSRSVLGVAFTTIVRVVARLAFVACSKSFTVDPDSCLYAIVRMFKTCQ